MAQVLVNGTAIGSSGSSPKVWWWISGICFVFFLLMIVIDTSTTDGESYDDCMDDALTYEEIIECDNKDYSNNSDIFAIPGMISCCFSLLAGIIALSHGSKKTTVLVQQMPQMYTQPVIQQVIQQPIQQRPQGQIPAQQTQQQRQPPQGNQQNLAQQAKNLEMARDFKGAADMYQKAGLFAEAGRVRQNHLEKDDKPVVQIGQVGNSVVKDSVVMGTTNQPTNCPNCGSSIQSGWKFCPSCNSPL
ncbi:MAG: zinc ribbon domain-containing protein [Euryarchaeota archaeon]|nr:zinc ribbon domain-containing protein [Euryarchaeota archaeon]MBT5735637.1 zinc ribbon domain-containing protein [Euryarchaeota archaeon]